MIFFRRCVAGYDVTMYENVQKKVACVAWGAANENKDDDVDVVVVVDDVVDCRQIDCKSFSTIFWAISKLLLHVDKRRQILFEFETIFLSLVSIVVRFRIHVCCAVCMRYDDDTQIG